VCGHSRGERFRRMRAEFGELVGGHGSGGRGWSGPVCVGVRW
jgi:hypothetical protein